MVFEIPFIPFQSEIYSLLTKADEMNFDVYDSAYPIEEIIEPLRNLDEINFGVIADVSCTQTSTKTDSVMWNVNVRIELFSTYNGRMRIAEMANTIGNVVTQYVEAFDSNLSAKGYSVIKAEIGEAAIGTTMFAYGLQWQNGYINLNYRLYQLNT